MNYQEILISEKEREEKEAQQKANTIPLEVERLERQNWLNHPITQRALRDIDKLVISKNDLVLKNAFTDITSDGLRDLVIEVATIRKTLNLVKYGTYTDTVTDGSNS